jgi:rhodanese-related sulfurtransferase
MRPEITPRDLAARLEAGAPTYLVDVRQEWEYALVRLEGALLVPLGELETRWDEIRPPAGALVVAYCHHGVRSLNAAMFLASVGLPDVVSLAGGIDAWARHVDPALPRY